MKLTENLHILEILEPNFFGTVHNHNVVFIENAYKNGLVMVDTSLPGNMDLISSFLKKIHYSINDIAYIIVSHYHPDHSGNVNAIKNISGAKVIAHENEEEALNNYMIFKLKYRDVKSVLNTNKKEFYDTVRRINNIKLDPIKIDIKIGREQNLGKLKIINSHGHTRGHISVLYNDILIAGDAINNTMHPMPPFRFFCYNYDEAVTSYHKLIRLKSRIIVPFHGEIFKREDVNNIY